MNKNANETILDLLSILASIFMSKSPMAFVVGGGGWSTNALVGPFELLLDFQKKKNRPIRENFPYFSEPTNVEWIYVQGIRYLVANLLFARTITHNYFYLPHTYPNTYPLTYALAYYQTNLNLFEITGYIPEKNIVLQRVVNNLFATFGESFMHFLPEFQNTLIPESTCFRGGKKNQ